MNRKLALLVASSVLLLASLACGVFVPEISRPPISIPSPVWVQPAAPVVVSADLLEGQAQLVSLYENVYPGVVSIQVLTASGGGQGSGFVYDKQGHIVTNYHVVENATQIEVVFPSGLRTYGQVRGVDLDSDLAVIKVDVAAQELTPLPLGDSDALKVGQTVIAIGNPFGLSGTMTTGIVSALGRTLPSDRQAPGGGIFNAADLIQTDAAINPGNSGGPLFNLQGEVIGVNRAIRTVSSTSQGEPVNSGIGFAISVNIIKRVAPGIIENGKYDYPYMGIASISDFSLEAIQALDLPQPTGLYVTEVQPNSPAERAGLRGGSQKTSIPGLLAGGDLVIAIDGRPVKFYEDLMRYLISNKGPGDEVVLSVLRDGQQIEVSLTLDKRP
ncbi:MAG: trypsin-like peptidase domain-containing protein [Anaerolineales bacterium]|jgi:2-alkenal reductase|nr:trypsin-like peptidase domain-containing protein [Anaerolineales bacterium]